MIAGKTLVAGVLGSIVVGSLILFNTETAAESKNNIEEVTQSYDDSITSYESLMNKYTEIVNRQNNTLSNLQSAYNNEDLPANLRVKRWKEINDLSEEVREKYDEQSKIFEYIESFNLPEQVEKQEEELNKANQYVEDVKQVVSDAQEKANAHQEEWEKYQYEYKDAVDQAGRTVESAYNTMSEDPNKEYEEYWSKVIE